MERCIPDLSRSGENGAIEDAIMDVVAVLPNASRHYWFDVSVRSPHAARYNEAIERNAGNVPGFAAEAGFKEKRQRYQSDDVIPIAFEPYGRIGDSTVTAIKEVAVNAATLSQDHRSAPTC